MYQCMILVGTHPLLHAYGIHYGTHIERHFEIDISTESEKCECMPCLYECICMHV